MAPTSTSPEAQAAASAPRALEPVAPNDAVWLQDSSLNLMVINSIFTVDRMPVETLRDVFSERVMAEPSGRYDRFRKRILKQGGRWWWQHVEEFDLSQHIFEVEEPLRSREDLQRYIGQQASKPLPDDRPPWQLQIVHDFADGETAIITRVHHVMGDGMALLPVIFELMDLEDQTADEVRAQQVKTRGSVGKPWQIALRAVLAAGPILVSQALRKADATLFHGPELSGVKRVAWTPDLSLDRIKAIKDREGATVNDVLLTIVSGAFLRYARRHPDEHVERVRVSMPVDVRGKSHAPKLENRFGAVFVELPTAIEDVAERLAEIKRRMDALKRSVAPMVYYGAATAMLKLLPTSFSHWVLDFYASKCTAVLSNVPGPRETLSIAGHTVRAMLFWVPQRSNIGLGISILSFSGTVRVGVFADTAILQDPNDLVHEILAELEHVDSVL